jgi:23S rRNA pseudouridine2605 synthase
VIHEGRKRQVRLMCAAVGHPVRVLVRTRVGEVLLARLPTGKTRPLSKRELSSLRELVGLASAPPTADD